MNITMEQNADFKKLARKAYLLYHQDGIIDLLVGWVIIAFGMNIALDESTFTFLAWFPILLYTPLKTRITIPRFGYVKFDDKYSGGNKMVIALILGVLVLMVFGVLVFLLRGPASPPAPIIWIRENELLFYGLVGALFFAVAALISGIRRMVFYSIWCLFLMAAGQALGVHEFVPFLLLGGIVFMVGIVLVVRFIRKYPIET